MDLHVQISLSTRDKRYSVPSHPISIPRSSTADDLRNVLSELLEDDGKSVCFDFLINEAFLEGTLDEFLTESKVTSEVINIEFTVRQAAPKATAEFKHDDFVSCVRRCGKYILTSSYDGTVQLRTVDESVPIFVLTMDEHQKVVEWISLGASDSDDSTFLTGGFGQVVRIWAWNPAESSVKCVAACRGHKDTIISLASTSNTSDGGHSLFASSSFDSTIKVWSACTATSDLIEETGGISHKRKSEDKISIRIPRLTLAGHHNMVSRVCWFADASSVSGSALKLISCGWDQSIRLWDVTVGSNAQMGEETRCIMVGSPLHDLSVASQGVLVGASDNKVRIYDLRAKDALAQIGFQGHSGWLTSVAWAPHRTDQFVTGSVDKVVKLWDTRRSSSPLYDLMGHRDIVTSVDWAPPDENGLHYILSASADGTAKLYHYPT